MTLCKEAVLGQMFKLKYSNKRCNPSRTSSMEQMSTSKPKCHPWLMIQVLHYIQECMCVHVQCSHSVSWQTCFSCSCHLKNIKRDSIRSVKQGACWKRSKLFHNHGTHQGLLLGTLPSGENNLAEKACANQTYMCVQHNEPDSQCFLLKERNKESWKNKIMTRITNKWRAFNEMLQNVYFQSH